MNRIVLFVVVCLFVQGCAKGLDENADIDQAGPSLRTALEAWKSGKSQADLETQTPSVLMNEMDWKVGKRLLEFKMEEKGTMHGRQVRWRAQIKVQDKNGDTREQVATYVIDTTPRIVIVRDNFADL